MRRSQIEDLSRKVNVLLERYIQIHNGIYSRPWWHIFKPIPFDTYEAQLSSVETALKEGERLSGALKHGAARFELQHLYILHRYILALLSTVTLLGRILIALKAKADGKPYKLKEYNADCDAYQLAVNDYTALGGELNQSWKDFVAKGPVSSERTRHHLADDRDTCMSQSEKDRRSADLVTRCEQSLKAIRRASLEVESGMTPLDQALMCQPIVSSLNLLCGRRDNDRFKPLDANLLVEAVTRLHRAGLLNKALAVSDEGSVEKVVLTACVLSFGLLTDVNDEAREAARRVSKETSNLLSNLNRAADTK